MNTTANAINLPSGGEGPGQTRGARPGNWTRAVVAPGQGWSPLALRLTAGVIFFAHGAQKLFGWFGGYGLQGTGQFMDSIGLSPGYLMALLAGSAEFFGGIALLIGVLVRPAGVVLAFTMVVAIVTTHLGNGLFLSNNGYEFGLALLGISVALAVSGAGRLSVDGAIARMIARR